MRVRFVDGDGAHERLVEDLVVLLGRDDGFAWIDVPGWDDETAALLRGLDCHPKVIEACRVRNHVPTVHAYPDHLFVTMHAPLLGEAGHVHLLEIDMVVGARYLLTVHGPLNPVVDPVKALVETDGVLRRIEAGRFRPGSPAEVMYAVASAVARSQRALIGDVAERLPGLEQQVMHSRLTQPEELLERMFLIRYELITARTMAAQTHDVCARMGALDRWVPEETRRLARDLADQFDRVRSVADGEAQFLFGVIELYQTKVNTKMTVAMERLAVIAAVTLPITAIASVLGMNHDLPRVDELGRPGRRARVDAHGERAAALGAQAGLVVASGPPWSSWSSVVLRGPQRYSGAAATGPGRGRPASPGRRARRDQAASPVW